MTSDSGSNSGGSKPFEWLSGGLFFGKGKDGIESVDSCKDVISLLNGIDENLKSTLAEKEQQQQQRQRQRESSSINTSTSAGDTVATKPSSGDGAAATTSASNTGTSKSQDGKEEPSQAEFLAARLSRLRFLLYDERRVTSQQDNRRYTTPAVAGATVQALTGTGSGGGKNSLPKLIPTLIEKLTCLPFESRKHVAAIFNYLIVCGFDGSDRDAYIPIMCGFRDYVEANFESIVTPIVMGYDIVSAAAGVADVCLHDGTMFRSCMRHGSLYRQLVLSTERVETYVLPFLDKYVHNPNFDVSSDAMESLKIIFTAGSDAGQSADPTQMELAEAAAAFLTRDYDMIWDQRFNPKLLSDQANYMTKRVALQILSTVLLTRSNYAVMIKYVNSRKNLILVMHLLRDMSPHITLDAFHVFKVFVANPNKIPEVEKILKDNRVKLCAYLETLHQDKESRDNQFRDEKALIVNTIRNL